MTKERFNEIQLKMKDINESKERWLNFYKERDKYKDCDFEVLSFINNIAFFPDREAIKNDSIDHLFLAGYCYYFALILKNAFNRGTICWVVNRGHIVWLDGEDLKNDIAYDIKNKAR